MRFLKNLFVVVAFVYGQSVVAQLKFGGPSAVTYSPDSKKYYVVNQVTQDVIEMNKWGQGRTFISGLNSPTNILYANLPLGAGFLILDSNQVHLFDTTGFQLGSENVAGAQRLQDFVFDAKDEVLYTTDIKRNVIYKTTFGPPPFYIPSTAIFADSLRSPAGVYLDKPNNRLLYTEFVDSSFIKTVNLSTGTVGDLVQTGLDSVIAIDKDLQGNFYLSSQGDKGVYSWNKYLSGAPKRVFYEPKPSDFMINTLTDEWAYLCYSCGKVYIVELHIEGPYYELQSCPGDSVTVYLHPGLKTIGTYDKSNTFIAELSDENMSFNTGNNTIIGEAEDTLRPKIGMRTFIPKNLKPGTYKLRIRTTKPAGASRFDLFRVNEVPEAQAYTADTASLCNGSVLTLGVGKDSTNTYLWSPSNLVNTDSIANPAYLGSSNKWVFLETKDKTTGCANRDSVFVQIITKPQVTKVKDTLTACLGDTIELGVSNTDYDFSWSPGNMLSDSTLSNPKYHMLGSTKFTCTYRAKGGCSNSFEQVAVVHNNPRVKVWNKEVYLCPNENKEVKILLNGDGVPFDSSVFKSIWYVNGKVLNQKPEKVSLNQAGLNRFILENRATGCLAEDSMQVMPYDSLNVDLNLIGRDTLQVSVVGNPGVAKYTWYKNNGVINGADMPTYIPIDSGEYHVKVRTDDSCFFTSQRIKYTLAANGTLDLFATTRDFYVHENSYGIQLLSKSNYKGTISLWVYSLNGQQIKIVEGAKAPCFVKGYTSPGLNIAYVITEEGKVQKLKFIRMQ